MTSALQGEGDPQKEDKKEQNQLICDSDKGEEGVKKSEIVADVIYGSPLSSQSLRTFQFSSAMAGGGRVTPGRCHVAWPFVCLVVRPQVPAKSTENLISRVYLPSSFPFSIRELVKRWDYLVDKRYVDQGHHTPRTPYNNLSSSFP